jgi:phosphoribosylanthranilate isomerase
MIIKVCGLTNNTESHAVASLQGVDMLGFIFYEGSPRFTESTFETNKKKIGVFVDAPLEYIVNQSNKHKLSALQLHGNESPEYIRQLPQNIEVIKAFGIATGADLLKTIDYEGLADYFLFDTKSPNHGGTGKTFNWSVLEAYKGNTPFLLSGGVGPESVNALREFKHPQLIGYDLNSRFETAPKIKNAALVAQFIKDIKL